ncbi:ImmA/IrrE family metallo-endopeptidase [Phaeobacter inhibens]|uniref:ImmA/IrrE family metallo-endopeptidase n=1 Tax=Phaeobacter inhibens TaxID=221822 RepID=UPI0018F7A23D
MLGSANFSNRSIQVNRHDDRNRERFTVAHEIGHFFLEHDKYLRSESIVERDLFIETETKDAFNYDRLEYQANLFGSMLLLPEAQFRHAVKVLRRQLNVNDRGFGYIFVDDQPCNYTPYNQILTALSDHFGASKRAIEIRLKRAGLVTDMRGTGSANRLRFPGV